MNINDAINQMNLVQLNELLNKPPVVKFSGYDLYRPQISWKKHGYEGFINFNELTQHIFKTHDRYLTLLQNSILPLAEKRIARLQQIETTIATVQKAKEIDCKVLTMWRNRSRLGSIAAAASSGIGALNFMAKLGLRKQTFTFFRSHLILERRGIEQVIAIESKIHPYKIMGLSPKATNKEIKKKYKIIALKIHPDKNISDPEATRKFKKLQDAYDILKDPIKRLEYDLECNKENEINFTL